MGSYKAPVVHDTDFEASKIVATDANKKLISKTIGIADNNSVEIDAADVADNDYAKFTAAGVEGRSYSEVRQDLDLEIGTDVQAYNSNLTGINQALDTTASPTFNQGNFTTLHTTTLLTDHIGEHTASHKIIVDNIIDLTKGVHIGNSAATIILGGLGIRSSSWTGDAGWQIFHNASDATTDYGLCFYNISTTIMSLTATTLTFSEGLNISVGTTTGTKIGTATNQKIAFHNATPVVQASHIADSGGVIANAHAAINAILVVLENKGFIATS